MTEVKPKKMEDDDDEGISATSLFNLKQPKDAVSGAADVCCTPIF